MFSFSFFLSASTRRRIAVDTSCQDAVMKLPATLTWLHVLLWFTSEMNISFISRSLQMIPLEIPPE